MVSQSSDTLNNTIHLVDLRTIENATDEFADAVACERKETEEMVLEVGFW